MPRPKRPSDVPPVQWIFMRAAWVGDCLEYPWDPTTGSRYPILTVEGKNKKTHRLVFEYFYGDLSPAVKVCHSCDNTLCCWPEHLWSGTQLDNIRDMLAKGRGRHQIDNLCSNGLHDLSSFDAFRVKVRGDGSTYTQCVECRKLMHARRYEREMSRG